MAKVKFMLDEATNRRGCLIELPWTAGSANFTLTCQWEPAFEEPVWTLYEQDGSSSKVVWTQSFAPSDLEFMYDILAMSAPKTTAYTAIPELLKPEVAQEDSGDRRLGGESAISGGYPMMAPLPQPGMPPVPVPQQQQSYSNLQAQQGGPGGMGMDPHQQPYPGMPYPPHPGYPQQAPPQGYNPYGMPQQMQQMPPQMQPYPQQYPPGYPPQQQMPQQMQQMQPMQQMPQTMPPGYPPAQAQMHPGGQAADSPRIPLDYHLLDKRPNMLLGSMLQEAGLISEPTLEAALKLQELIRDEKIPPERAPAILKRLHSMGGNIDQYLTPDDTISDGRRTSSEKVKRPSAPPAGGGGGGGGRPGGPPAGAPSGAPAAGPDGKRNLKPAFDLLQKAGILSEDDIQDALAVRKKHGGDLVGILEAAGKVNRKTVDAAFICLPLIREGLLKMEQCIIALNYCSRMRVGFDEALDEMGWQNPRKLRSDLPL
jgi:hypothetical protein